MDAGIYDRINKYATCGMMAGSAGKLIGTGVAALWTAGTVGSKGIAMIPLTAGALQLMATLSGCSEGELDENPVSGGGGIDGCYQLASGQYAQLEAKRGYDGSNWDSLIRPGIPTAATNAIVGVTAIYNENNPGAKWESWVSINAWDGNTLQTYDFVADNYPTQEIANKAAYRIASGPGIDCEASSDLLPEPPPDATAPITYTDSESGCELNVTLQGFAQDFENGPANPVWLVEGAEGETRASGSRFGGCNFAPVVVYNPNGPQGPGGPTPPYPPIPVPDGGKPIDWKTLLATAAASAAGKLAYDAIKALLTQPYDETEFELVAPCDRDKDGEQLVRKWEFEKAKFEVRCLDHQVAILEVLQQHLDWKTPTCDSTPDENPAGRYWRSLAFESEDSTDNSRRRLHKRFRYRSNAPGDVGRLYDHWRDFVWDTGDICVIHRGSALGTPQVWAASVVEGKRVIYHAAAEAGVTPDQDGEWIVSGSNNPRIGVSRTVKLKEVNGTWAATARQGSSGYPDAVWTTPEP